MHEHTALLIIDQQKGIDHPKLGQRNNPDAEKIILELLQHWRQNQWPIIHVKHRSTEPESIFWPEQDGFNFKEETAPIEQEVVLEKNVPCAFTGSTLEKIMTDIGAGSLVIVGVVTNNSVESTARTGGNLGYDIKVVHDACFTFAQSDFFGVERTAKDVHAMSLANIDGEYAQVVHSSDLLNNKA